MAVRHGFRHGLHHGSQEAQRGRGLAQGSACGTREKEGAAAHATEGPEGGRPAEDGPGCGERLTPLGRGSYMGAPLQRAPTPPLLPGRTGRDDGHVWGGSCTGKRKTRLLKTQRVHDP